MRPSRVGALISIKYQHQIECNTQQGKTAGAVYTWDSVQLAGAMMRERGNYFPEYEAEAQKVLKGGHQWLEAPFLDDAPSRPAPPLACSNPSRLTAAARSR